MTRLFMVLLLWELLTGIRLLIGAATCAPEWRRPRRTSVRWPGDSGVGSSAKLVALGTVHGAAQVAGAAGRPAPERARARRLERGRPERGADRRRAAGGRHVQALRARLADGRPGML